MPKDRVTESNLEKSHRKDERTEEMYELDKLSKN